MHPSAEILHLNAPFCIKMQTSTPAPVVMSEEELCGGTTSDITCSSSESISIRVCVEQSGRVFVDSEWNTHTLHPNPCLPACSSATGVTLALATTSQRHLSLHCTAGLRSRTTTCCRSNFSLDPDTT